MGILMLSSQVRTQDFPFGGGAGADPAGWRGGEGATTPRSATASCWLVHSRRLVPYIVNHAVIMETQVVPCSILITSRGGSRI